MTSTKRSILSLFLVLTMMCSLLPLPSAAVESDNTLEPENAVGEVIFDIGKGSVIASADGITGVTGDGTSTTILWADMAGYDFVVTGTADAASGYHIEVAADCPQNAELTLRGVSITTKDTTNQYSAICNKSADKELTLNLEGANSLKAETWRLLWNEGGVIRFVGRGDNPSLNLVIMQDDISLMRSVNGTFAFESCAVEMNRAVGADNQVASDGTTVEISNGATITDSNGTVFSEANVVEIVHDLSTATADVEIGKAEAYRKEYTYTDTSNVKRMWTLVYPNVKPLHIVTGTVENANYRVTVTSPEANIMLRDLTLKMSADGSRSAFLVKYTDPADYGKQLTVKVSGDVSLTAGTASTFNTNDVDNSDPSKRTQPQNVLIVGDPTDGADTLTITRTSDTGEVSIKAAVNVNLTAENLKVVVQKNCNFNVTAGTGSVVIVGGYIGGEAVENGGQLLESNFRYKFVADGHVFVPVADKSNGNVPTLLLPGNADLSRVTLAGTPGWTVEGYTTDADGNTILDFTVNDNNTLNLTVTPPAEIIAVSGTAQTITVRAMKSSDIPAVCLNLTEGTMSAVNGDPDHETTAKGSLSLLNDKSGGTELLNIEGTEIKGRGNASWNRAKKSYQIKLDSKANVLGMGNSKKWILVPSAADLSMMRSAVGFKLAQELGMEFAAHWEFVDFYVDGEYYGLYILCEKPEVGTNRIDITNLDDVLEDAIGKDNILSEQTGVTYSDDYKTATVDGIQIDLTGGYHLEFDNYDDPMQFAAGNINRITVKEPECLGTDPRTDECFTYIRNFMADADAAVNDTTSNDILKYIDIESFAQMWLLKQFMDDYDAVRNMHIWKESEQPIGDGKIHAGPAWDFDNSMCRDIYDVTTAVNNAKSHTYFNESGSALWLKKLENHPAFQAEVVKQYKAHANLFTGCDNCTPNTCGDCYIHNFVALQAEKTADATVMDTVRWYGTTFSNKPVNTENRATSLQVVEAFACTRSDYLKDRIEGWEAVHAHQWNEGEVTQQATCTENGEKTFTCEVCGNTETEVIPALGHDYSVQQHDTVQHWNKCSRCDATDTKENHTGGTATCTQHAVCEVCHTIYGELAAHEWSTTYLKENADESKHYHVCTVCNVKDIGAVHTPGDEATETTPQICTVCEYVLVPATGHVTHTTTLVPAKAATCTEAGNRAYYTCSGCSDWFEDATGNSVITDHSSVVLAALGHDYSVKQHDATQHWNKCSRCDATDTKENHVYDNDSDKTCNVCGYTRATGGGSSGGGGGGVISIIDTYPPLSAIPENGSVSVSPEAPAKGDKVTITPKPDDGFEVDEIIVTDENGKPVEITDNGDGTWTFTQPAGKVNIKVTFKATNPFIDVKEDDYFYDSVLWAVKKGVTNGTSATTFSPNDSCTRAQIVTFLWRAAGSPAPKDAENPFTDVKSGDYFYDAVLWAVENGITSGTSATTLSPDDSCTRAQIITFLWRAADSPVPKGAENPFTDVKPGDYFYDAVLWAVENGITSGTSATTYSPNDSCTRAQAMTFLWRAAGSPLLSRKIPSRMQPTTLTMLRQSLGRLSSVLPTVPAMKPSHLMPTVPGLRSLLS